MARIKRVLLAKEEAVKGSEQRRTEREMKRYGKRVQAERLQEKAAKRRADSEAVKRARTSAESSAEATFASMDFAVGLEDKDDKRGGAGRGRGPYPVYHVSRVCCD